MVHCGWTSGVVLIASLGIGLVIRSVNWFYIWLGLEFTIISFVGFISTKREPYQKLVTYFVAQVFGRFILLLGTLTSFPGALSVALVGIAFKMGFVGGHIWAAGFVRGLCPICLLWFLVLMKVGPLAVSMGSLPIVVIALLTTLVGLSYLGMTSSLSEFIYWRGLLGRSWLWIVRQSKVSWFYFFLYRLVLIWLFLSPVVNEFYVFSFAGVPPLALFFGKVTVLNSVSVITLVFLTFLACASLIYYSRWLSRVSSRPEQILPNQSARFTFVLLRR